MNGLYEYTAMPGGTPGLMPKQYKDYPGGVESYDVYSPVMTTLYSQVFWTSLPPVDVKYTKQRKHLILQKTTSLYFNVYVYIYIT